MTVLASPLFASRSGLNKLVTVVLSAVTLVRRVLSLVRALVLTVFAVGRAVRSVLSLRRRLRRTLPLTKSRPLAFVPRVWNLSRVAFFNICLVRRGLPTLGSRISSRLPLSRRIIVLEIFSLPMWFLMMSRIVLTLCLLTAAMASAGRIRRASRELFCRLRFSWAGIRITIIMVVTASVKTSFN